MKKLILTIFIFSFTITCYSQWTEQTSGVTTALYSVSAFDDNNVWVCSTAGKVLRTTNGGANWVLGTITGAPDLYVIMAIDANTALVSGSSANTFVYKTTNGGANWTQVFTQTGGFIDVIAPVQSTPPIIALVGDPVGGRWSIWASTDNGNTFDSTGLPYIPQAGAEGGFNNSYAYYRYPSGRDYFWFGTNNTRIYRISGGDTIGGGSSYTVETTTGLASVDLINMGYGVNGIAGGATTLGTNDSGNTWGAYSLPGTGNLTGFAGAIPYVYYCRGTGIYMSTNSGSNYSLQYTAPAGSYYHMAQSSHYAWAIRSNGGISRLTNPIGIQNLGTQTPAKFELEQNYPNPFNPATKIKFDIPVKSNVKIVVTDIVGRTVGELFNGNISAGTYETKWDGSNFASGIYFVMMTTDTYSDTKKIVLLK